jgi:hypothetical protein
MSLRNSISIIIIVLIDFIIYLLPVCLLVLIPNLFISLIWYLPSIYQLYSFIFTTKEFDLRIRTYLFILSPIIIILYIPCCIITFISFIIFITLINPIMVIARRPEYPFYLLSSTAAIVRLIYQLFFEHSDDYGLFIDSLIFKPINESIEFSKECWKFHSSKLPDKSSLNPGVLLILLMLILLIFLFDLITIFIAYILIILFYLTIVVSIFITVKYFVTLFDITAEISKKSIENITRKHKIWISIIVLIFILPLSFVVSVAMFPIIFIFYFIFYVLINILILACLLMYKMTYCSYYDIMSFFWAIIIKPFLTSDFSISAGMELFFYNVCGISNIAYNKELVKEVNKYYIF